MLDLTKPLRTRDGRRATLISTNATLIVGGHHYPIIAEVEHPNEPEGTVRWHYLSSGQWKSNDPKNHNDLVNEKPWHRWLGAITGWKK